MGGGEMAAADPAVRSPFCVAALLTCVDLVGRWRRRRAKAQRRGPVMHAGGDETFRPSKVQVPEQIKEPGGGSLVHISIKSPGLRPRALTARRRRLRATGVWNPGSTEIPFRRCQASVSAQPTRECPRSKGC
jgi:hypothetical protein